MHTNRVHSPKIRSLFCKNRAFFSIFKKGHGGPPPTLLPASGAPDTTKYSGVPFVTPRDIMRSFFMMLSNASKFAVVQYHKMTLMVESFLVKLSTWGCNIANRRTLSQLFLCEFYKIFQSNFFERRSLVECL